MDVISTSDTIIFLTISVPIMIVVTGFRNTITFFLTAVPFLTFKLPMDVLTNRVLRSYDQRPAFAQKTSLYEYVIVECVEWGISIADAGAGVTIFFGRQLSLFLYLYRRYRNGAANLGDAQYSFIEPEDGIEGVWINSRFRGDVHDIIIYYVHGGGPGYASIHFYLEFLISLLGSLQMQGFKNPAIFAIEYPLVPQANFTRQLPPITAGWNYLCTEYESSTLTVCGDSNGAGLLLSLLLHIAHPSPDISEVPIRRRPEAGVLISPWTDLYSAKRPTRSDYISPKIILRHADRLSGGDRNNVYINPALCRSREWWHRACPDHGLYLSYGEEEMLANDIIRFSQGLQSAGCPAISRPEPHQLHSWQILQFYLGRTPQHRVSGLDDIAASLAKMVLWHTSTITENSATHDTKIPLRIT